MDRRMGKVWAGKVISVVDSVAEDEPHPASLGFPF